jgi:hypothetical protein
MQKKKLILALLAGLAMSGAAQAALHDRGGGLIYDSYFNITWLADANYAKTQYMASGGASGDADGQMNWATANTWAANLSYYDSIRNVTYDNWRLPTALNADNSGPCFGYNCKGSEMGHLFYVDGGLSLGQSILSSTSLDDYFINMQSYYYWSRLEAGGSGTAYAWSFTTSSGYQGSDLKAAGVYAWAVRPGDVAAVPEADTWAMLLAGLGLVGVAARRRRV